MAVFVIITALASVSWDVVSADINYVCTFLWYPSIIIILRSKVFRIIFSSRIWGKLGEISYNVYIWHVVLMLAVMVMRNVYGIAVPIDTVSSMWLFTLGCFVIGTISHYCIEKPINKFIKNSGNASEAKT